MSKVFWDTNLFIYLFERNPIFAEKVRSLRRRMLARGDQLFTSTFTLGELLVKPVETEDTTMQAQYKTLLTSASALIPFDDNAALHYASIRRDRSITAPDAIQLACAATANIDLFITNDSRLSQKVIPGVQFLTSLENAPL